MTLTENTDYKVTYSDDLVNMGTVTVTVTGTGNYTGTLSRSYEITPIDISKEGKIEAIADQPYTGSSIEPDVKVTFGESALTRDTDYTVSYAGNTNAGTASVTVTGTGNYKGKVTGSFAITPADLTEEMVTLGTDPSYTGSNVQAGVTVTWNGKKLEENTDYTCTYSNNTAVGTNTASVTINGKGNFRGSVAKTFSIMQADLSKGSISGLSNAVYTGSEIKQNPVVKVGGTKLNEGTDYTVSFSDDLVNIGTVTVTVTGKGNYTGTLTGSYKIQEKPKETEEEQKLGFVSAFAVPDGNGRGFLLYLTTGEYARKRAPKKRAWAFVRKDVFPALVSLAKECGLAKENGHHSSTAGLPENFGGSISVRYASGETISVSNNQSPVLTRETAFRIVRLFEEAMQGEKAVLPDLSDLTEISCEECRKNGGYTKARLTILPDGSGVVRSSSKYDRPEVFENEHPMEAGRVAGILSKIAENGILAWSGLPASAFGFGRDRTTSFFFRNGQSVVIEGDKVLPEGLSSVLWDVQREMTAAR